MSNYRNWSPREITSITYNFISTEINAFDVATVNADDVISIHEHRAGGEGDRWFYDIVYKHGEVHRIFNPNKVYYTNVQP